MSMLNKKTIEDIDVRGKTVIVRVDFNVPQDENLNITDDSRIEGALPTIRYLIANKAKIILVSHLGRPKNGPEKKFSMAPCAKRLGELLGMNIIAATDVIGPDAKAKASALQEGQVMILENVRFHKEEEANDPAFAKELASMAQIFVNDAFGTAHRAHASTAGIAAYLPSVMGFLIEKEINFLGKTLNNPVRPFVAILGGAKISDKIGVIEALLKKVDTIIIGGGMAYTFLKAKGYKIGKSICEDDKIDLAKSIMEKAEATGVKLMLPIGSIVGKEFKNDTEFKYVPSDDMPDDWMGMDIGSLTIEKFSKEISKAGTIFWNGPMGVFEFPNFANGTREIARAVADSHAVSIVGGGDSSAAIEQLGFAGKITHISTGGGASLEFLEGLDLPGISCLMNKDSRRKIAAGNWKMHKTPSETVKFIQELKDLVESASCEVVIGVPFVGIPAAVTACEGTKIKVAAQNMHWEEKGAFTGEISGNMLEDAGAAYVIIGHSERRQYFGETDETVNRKLHAALSHGLIPILCVGESLTQRELGVTDDLIRYQVKIALKDISSEDIRKTVIAYEPIWAIGTGRTATAGQAGEVCGTIRATLDLLYGNDIASLISILYGGSVTADNAAALFAESDIDGGLIGGASLKTNDFAVIAKSL